MNAITLGLHAAGGLCKIVCSWCEKTIGYKEFMGLQVSHGICRPCMCKYFPDVAEKVFGKEA